MDLPRKIYSHVVRAFFLPLIFKRFANMFSRLLFLLVFPVQVKSMISNSSEISSCKNPVSSCVVLRSKTNISAQGGHPVITSAAVEEDGRSYMHFTEVPSFSLSDSPASNTAQHAKKKRGRPANSCVSQKLPRQDQCIPCKTKMGRCLRIRVLELANSTLNLRSRSPAANKNDTRESNGKRCRKAPTCYAPRS